MTSPTLAVYLFGHNLETIRYPYLASIDSALALSRFINGAGGGLVYFAVCDCTDDTERQVVDKFQAAISSGELKLVYHLWGRTHYIQVEVCNFLLEQIGDQVGYALKLDADEVVHEDSFEAFRQDLDRMMWGNWQLGCPHYTHLLDNDRETDFIYRSKAVLCKTGVGLSYSDNDACALGGAAEVQTGLEILHLGKYQVGRRREALLKEITFTELYKDLGFPDPRVVAQLKQGYIDYDKIFENAAHLGQIRPWLGTFPIFVRDWIAESQVRDEAFRQALAQGDIQALETNKWW